MSHSVAWKHLGGHRFRATHRVSVKVDGKPDRDLVSRYELTCAPERDCHGREESSAEYGVELYRMGEQTFFRHRYQRFMRFSEEPEEANRRIQRIWGAAAAVVELLGSRLAVTPAGETTAAGRRATRYKLSRQHGPPARASGARAWRKKMQVLSVKGEALLDTATGAPLGITISYSVSAPKGAHRVTISGQLEASVLQAGASQKITPPRDFIVARPRPRETRDLRMLGSHRLNPGWFRGGGPQAAHRRARQGMSGGAPRPARGDP